MEPWGTTLVDEDENFWLVFSCRTYRAASSLDMTSKPLPQSFQHAGPFGQGLIEGVRGPMCSLAETALGYPEVR